VQCGIEPHGGARVEPGDSYPSEASGAVGWSGGGRDGETGRAGDGQSVRVYSEVASKRKAPFAAGWGGFIGESALIVFEALVLIFVRGAFLSR
jgi:hypothetical protein